MRGYLVGFNEECFEVEFTSDAIRVRSGLELEVRERMVMVQGVLSSEVHGIRNGRKKAVYVRHVGITMRCNSFREIVQEISSPLAQIKYTRSRLGGYLTIITSGRFLTDYIVVDESAMAIVLPGRREVYAEMAGNVLTLYIV
ncbi:MAG: hypothetical protein QXP03_00885 [Desulfurococcaceae archaeon]